MSYIMIVVIFRINTQKYYILQNHTQNTKYWTNKMQIYVLLSYTGLKCDFCHKLLFMKKLHLLYKTYRHFRISIHETIKNNYNSSNIEQCAAQRSIIMLIMFQPKSLETNSQNCGILSRITNFFEKINLKHPFSIVSFIHI